MRDRDALAALQPDLDLVAGLRNADGLVAWCEVATARWRSGSSRRGWASPEDPATGSAAGALGSLRVFRGATPGPLLVRQGARSAARARSAWTIGGEAGAPTDVRVGGRAVLVFEGTTTVLP